MRPDPGESLKDAVKRIDHGTLPFIGSLDADGLIAYHHRTGITMCGRHPVALMLETLKQAGKKTSARVLHYTTSGDVMGNWRSTVSYLSVALVAEAGER
ncbi:AmmeMemoRadiSam system protein B [Myxococcota bacterium]